MFSKNQQKLSGLLKQISLSERQLVIVRHKAVAAANQVNPDSEVKQYEDLPGPKGFIQVFANVVEGFRKIGQGHVLLQEKHKRYGPIFREHFPGMSFVQICDVKDIEHLLRNDHKYPSRIIMDSWVQWRKDAQESQGILIEYVESFIFRKFLTK